MFLHFNPFLRLDASTTAQVTVGWQVEDGVGWLNATVPDSVDVYFQHPPSCPTHAFNCITCPGTIVSHTNATIHVVGGGFYQLSC